MPAVHAIIRGRVQGVGYRYATQAQAVGLGLTGWVRNLPDGRVEACFAGTRENIEAMLEWCRSGPSLARVAAVETRWQEEDPGHKAFSIR